MKFTELPLRPVLQDALAARGYETATPVQAAVLDPALLERDLLVSSETGSGKTIAFGGALAETLLAAPSPAGGRGAAPIALVVVPTRELAAQVRAELAWLLHGTKWRLAAFTGGTPVGGDLRALERGVEIAIGTPGRLVDLLRRERLVLGELKVLVLDEADEMLDLGFREDLETILKGAPATRRTLLLSATMPPEIRTMARKYQQDAVTVDPRRGTDGAGGAARGAAHGDITYVAHLIAGGDRLAAVVNVLRAAGDARAIVFCTRRDAVGELHGALAARGFSATAISGDRAQAERDRALAQLRRGEVQLLVATNVAARGLDLPEIDLIVHADLPLNAESLTHRSGRTGRAGRKGTAVVLATLSERRKAERLLESAHVKPVWTPVPSADSIAAAARDHLLQALVDSESPAEPAIDELLRRFDGRLESVELARRLLARELARLPVGEPVASVTAPVDRAPGPSGSARGGVLFRVNLGGKDSADPRWLLPLICRRGGVTRHDVGAIRIGPHETLFEIAPAAAADFAGAAAELDPRARHVRIERADGPTGHDARPTHPRTERPAHPRTEHAARPPHPRPDRAPHPRAEPPARPAHPRAEHPPRPAHARPEHPSRPAHPRAEHSPRPAHARPEHPARPPHPRPPHAGGHKPYQGKRRKG